MKVDKVEERFKEGLPPLLLLDLDEWMPTVRQELTFSCEGCLDQFDPCPSRQLQTKWQRIEKNSQRPFCVSHLRSAIGYQPGDDIWLSMKEAQHSQMDCQEHALEGNCYLLGHSLEPCSRLI